MWAMEMHPDERPESVEQFRQVLFGLQTRPGRVGVRRAGSTWGGALRANRVVLMFALILMILAIILTIV